MSEVVREPAIWVGTREDLLAAVRDGARRGQILSAGPVRAVRGGYAVKVLPARPGGARVLQVAKAPVPRWRRRGARITYGVLGALVVLALPVYAAVQAVSYIGRHAPAVGGITLTVLLLWLLCRLPASSGGGGGGGACLGLHCPGCKH
jgi:hypothetical protein